MSLDETSQVHESITACLGERYIEWVPSLLMENKEIPVAAVILGAFLLRLIYPDLNCLWHWSKNKSLIAITGMVIYLTGAGVLETIGYKFLGGDALVYRLEVSAEEFMEMLGASLILYTAICFASDRSVPGLSDRVGGDEMIA
jgi:hypothetical protein